MPSLALLGLLSLGAAAPVWTQGPASIAGAPAARNPALASGGGRVHAVFRVRSGGVGHMVSGTGEPFAGAALLPGGESAAVGGGKNLPALAVDDAGRAHVAWGPASAPHNGAYYLRVGPDGAPLAAAAQVSARWVESIAVGVADGEVHVVITAIKEAEEPEPADGVFDLHGPVDGGPLAEVEAWPFPNFIDTALAPAAGGGLALIGRWDVIKRLNLSQGTWTDFANVALPPGWTSVGRPRLAGAAPQLWAVVGWQEATPVAVSVRSGGPKQPWTDLAGGVYDPEAADGEPAVALAAGPGDERAVAWLAADAPRLRVALGVGAWGEPTAMPGTDDATSFALAREAAGVYRVVFVTADGALHAGTIAADDGEDDTTAGTSGGDATGAATTDAGTSSAGTTDAGTSSAGTSSAGTTDAGASTADASGSAGGTAPAGATAGGPAGAGAPAEGGCACRVAAGPGRSAAGAALGLVVVVCLARSRR